MAKPPRVTYYGQCFISLIPMASQLGKAWGKLIILFEPMFSYL